ncbi:MT-A70 family methyltransferase [Rhodoplanes roseus]|uniref:MT-A70 family methyltransferase n=1 Tax=Rhodoplanes roseus TaxID=29409 RepID=UPI0014739DCF|nr:MT-A70 family methyltransferase [Rhodoplanes roseus]
MPRYPNLTAHPLAELFPLLSGPEFDSFAASVGTGLMHPIVLLDGRILDGRNRWRALVHLEERGVVPADLLDPDTSGAFVTFDNRNFRQDIIDAGPLAFVIRENLDRRHLSESQRAMLAARIATLREGRPPAAPRCAADETPPIGGVSAEAAGAMMNVGTRSVERARTVIREAAPETIAAVDRGGLRLSVAETIARLPVETQREIVAAADPKAFRAVVKVRRAEEQQEKKLRRDARERVLGVVQRSLPQGRRYGVILADPEWQFLTRSELGMDRAAANHYPVSPTETIAARDVESIAARDSILGLWATGAMIEDALAVMRAWGFVYKSQIVWTKPGMGNGYWFRECHELLLVGTRGSVPAPAMGTQWRSVREAPRGAHSEKPDWQYELFEQFYPTFTKIELNARATRPGWDRWGYEAPVGEGACAS